MEQLRRAVRQTVEPLSPLMRAAAKLAARTIETARPVVRNVAEKAVSASLTFVQLARRSTRKVLAVYTPAVRRKADAAAAVVLRFGARTGPALIVVATVLLVGLAVHVSDRLQTPPEVPKPPATRAELGSLLFFDINLSKNRTQACVSCHSASMAFADSRANDQVGGAASMGDDEKLLGERNAPTATYASLTPDFHFDVEGQAIGGFFLDGRAKTLEEQAAGPPLNPVEMGMADKVSVVARLKENPGYVAAFDALYGKDTLDDAEKGYAALTNAIAAFERTPEFAPFDSKYDRYLRGEVKLTDQEELGRVLFFSNQFTNCSQCHRIDTVGASAKETFTNYRYHNIGVPTNEALRAVNGKPADRGLAVHPNVIGTPQEASRAGKFKVPTLRNVAVTAPYMHNGVFKDLRTVVLFYDKYNSKAARRQINPETGKPWDPPEVPENLSMKELEIGPGLDDRRIDALVAFLKTLTDQRYERLLKQ
jgi:cytochrome c peroxidase